MEIFGIKLIGINGENGQKLLLTLLLVAAIFALRYGLRLVARLVFKPGKNASALFVARQAITLLLTLFFLITFLSVWFDDPTRLATAVGLVSAGLAFALQKVVTSVAGYFVILRGNNFTVGDRIQMGGVRGDVIGLGFIQTLILEMGQPPSVQGTDPAMWIKSRQFTGRIVTVTNSRIFDEPVYNYTRDFPYIWEEITIPITYDADRDAAERVLMEAARGRAIEGGKLDESAILRMQNQYYINSVDLDPKVYLRITDNWLELTVRFLTVEHGVRDVKDEMSREILKGLDAAGIGIASATYDIVGFPPLKMARDEPAKGAPQP